MSGETPPRLTVLEPDADEEPDEEQYSDADQRGDARGTKYG